MVLHYCEHVPHGLRFFANCCLLVGTMLLFQWNQLYYTLILNPSDSSGYNTVLHANNNAKPVSAKR